MKVTLTHSDVTILNTVIGRVRNSYYIESGKPVKPEPDPSQLLLDDLQQRLASDAPMEISDKEKQAIGKAINIFNDLFEPTDKKKKPLITELQAKQIDELLTKLYPSRASTPSP